MDDRERYAAGMQVRRAVLGDAHVDRANAAQTDLTAPFQDLITRYAWGEIWTRPGLPRHTRSLLTIAMMVALGRDGELRLHLRAASNNGVTRDEIQETLLADRHLLRCAGGQPCLPPGADGVCRDGRGGGREEVTPIVSGRRHATHTGKAADEPETQGGDPCSAHWVCCSTGWPTAACCS